MISPIFKLDSRERWRPQPVETAERLAKIDGRPVDLSALPETGRMDFPRDMKDPNDTPAVGYHRVVEKANLFWHQFWLWYLYNPWPIDPIPGRHEGDWEFVQVACVDNDGMQPVLMTASQHRTGEKREFWRCELADGRPVVYVALGSHANFFTPGWRGEDQANGEGDVIADTDWRAFGDWATWQGRWGNSTGAGRSPESPGNQRERWHEPHIFHGRAS